MLIVVRRHEKSWMFEHEIPVMLVGKPYCCLLLWRFCIAYLPHHLGVLLPKTSCSTTSLSNVQGAWLQYRAKCYYHVNSNRRSLATGLNLYCHYHHQCQCVDVSRSLHTAVYSWRTLKAFVTHFNRSVYRWSHSIPRRNAVIRTI